MITSSERARLRPGAPGRMAYRVMDTLKKTSLQVASKRAISLQATEADI